MYNGTLPNREVSEDCETCNQQWVAVLWSVPKDYLATYALAFIALLIVLFSPWQRLLAWVSGFGLMIMWEDMRFRAGTQALQEIFYGNRSGRVHDLGLAYALCGVMAVLLLIALSPDLDELL